MAKCIPAWNLSSEASFVNIGNGFSLAKFSNTLDSNRVLDSQPWFVGGQIFSL